METTSGLPKCDLRAETFLPASLIDLSPFQLDLAHPIDDLIASLAEERDIDLWLSADATRERGLFDRVDALIALAFVEKEQNARGIVARTLLSLYDITVADPTSPRVVNQFHPTLLEVRRRLEHNWLADLLDSLRHQIINSPNIPVSQRLRAMWAAHPVCTHPLFDFLANTASRVQIAEMLKCDWALNIRFYDALIMSMAGSPHEARQELAKNFWDEMGCGNINKSHVMLFSKILASIPIKPTDTPVKSILGYEGLEGYNLFMLCVVNRRHYLKLLGIMAITELLDPKNYEKLLFGCRRVGFPEDVLEYYSEHAMIDIEHADGWLNNVIEPMTQKYQSAPEEILTGAALRLKTCHRYYDRLYFHLTKI